MFGEEEKVHGLVRVEVDHREKDSEVVIALAQMPEAHLQVCHLTAGDYRVEGRCVFEPKTVLDFIRSIIDGRLFGQAHRLLQLTQPVALILEGRSADWNGTL